MTSRYLLFTAVFSLFCCGAADAQWQKLAVYPNDFFNEVQFVDNSYGWVTRSSASVIRTVDGGNTWQSSDLPGATGSSNRDICFVSRTIGFVSGEDGIWKTTSGGATWTNITPSGSIGGSAGMWFIDASTGVYGVGGCLDSTVTFYRTTDAGTTWSSVQYTSTADVSVGGITSYGGTWYACGGRGKFWRSNDGGASWSMSNTGSNGWQEDIFVYNGELHIASTNGSTCGASSGGMLLRSTNGGSTWSTTTFASNLMWGVTRYSSTEGWACGDGGLTLKTTDAGATWVDQSCGISRAARVDDIHFTDATHGFAVGDGIYRISDQSFEASPDTIDFGSIKINTRSSDSLARIRSFFTSTTLASVRIAGADASQFEITGGIVAVPVGVCSQATVPVRFAPTTPGVKTALLEVSVPTSTLRRQVVLRGRGQEPEISISSKPVLDTMFCTTSVLDSIIVRNVGSAPLTITKVTHRDPPGGSLVAAGPALPIIIPPGERVWLKVLATASQPGPYESQLEIHSDDPVRSPSIVKMAYYRRRIEASLDNQVLTLAATPVGVRSGPSCVEYRNRGDGVQIIDTVDAAFDGVIFASGMVFPIVVPAGAAARLCFDATPPDTGWFSRAFTVRTSPCLLATPLTVRVLGRSAIVRSDTLVAMPAITCESSAQATVLIHNDGNDTLSLAQPQIGGKDASGLRVLAPTTWPVRIAPKMSSEITVALEPTTPGAEATAMMTFATNDRTASRASWSVRFTTTRLSATARPTKPIVDAGLVCVGSIADVRLFVESVGSSSARVSSARVLGDDASLAAVLVPPTGADLTPGARDSLSIRVSPTMPGAFRARVEIRTEPCARVDTVDVVGSASEVILRSSDNMALGTLLKGRDATTVIRVFNDGNVLSTYSTSTQSSRINVVAPAGAREIAPGSFAEITVSVDTDEIGAFSDELTIVSLGACRDTLRLMVSGNVVEAGGVAVMLRTRELAFGPLFRCEDSCSNVEIESVGERSVTLLSARIEAPGGSFRLGEPFMQHVVEPGAIVSIPVCYVPDGDADVAAGELIIATSDTANPELRVSLAGRSMAGLQTGVALSFGVVAKDQSRDTSMRVANPSTRPLDILWARVPEPFELVTQLPVTVNPGSSVELVVRARNVQAYALERVVLGTSHRCGDSLVIAFDALSDDRFTITTRADTAVGTWGNNVAIAVGYRDTTNARVAEMTLHVYAAPELLDPRKVSAGPGVSVEQLGYDAESGALRLRVRTNPGATIRSSDSLVIVTYAVLRGDAIATSVTPVALGLRPGVTSETEPGAFLLADYCDAHSRLLTVTGSIALEQNIPNPARAKTVIEFETSFDDHVLLLLFDARGNEIDRLIDEKIPAGRRRLEVDANRYPAGSYTYRLVTGVQSLSRRLIISH